MRGDLLRDRLRDALGDTDRLERELGGGCRASSSQGTPLGRCVVVRVLAPDVVAVVSAERFRREIQLAARLYQPHIEPRVAEVRRRLRRLSDVERR